MLRRVSYCEPDCQGYGFFMTRASEAKAAAFRNSRLGAAWTVGSIVALAVPCDQDGPTVTTKEVCMGTVC